MFDKLKSLLTDWKVSVVLVGGALVIGTVFGTCTFEPAAPDAEAPAASESESVGEEASATTGSGVTTSTDPSVTTATESSATNSQETAGTATGTTNTENNE